MAALKAMGLPSGPRNGSKMPDDTYRLQNFAGRFGFSAKVMRRHMRPVMRPGALFIVPPVAWAMASGPTAPSGEKPVGLSTSVSSATLVSTVFWTPVSWSVPIACTIVVRGIAPTVPTTAENASLESVPTSCPATASLYEPPVKAAFGSLTTR